MRKISESTVRRLSLYLRFFEQFDAQGQTTISSAELARRGGTTSAQVRKDLSFFGSFGKRGLGYSVPELTARIRDILGLRRTYRVVLVGAGRVGAGGGRSAGARGGEGDPQLRPGAARRARRRGREVGQHGARARDAEFRAGQSILTGGTPAKSRNPRRHEP